MSANTKRVPLSAVYERPGREEAKGRGTTVLDDLLHLHVSVAAEREDGEDGLSGGMEVVEELDDGLDDFQLRL